MKNLFISSLLLFFHTFEWRIYPSLECFWDPRQFGSKFCGSLEKSSPGTSSIFGSFVLFSARILSSCLVLKRLQSADGRLDLVMKEVSNQVLVGIRKYKYISRGID